MSSTKSALGRGLGDLLSGSAMAQEKNQDVQVEATTFQQISIDQLSPGIYQPRQDIEPEALKELASSIKVQGVIQPLVVRQLFGNNYEIIAGERRFRAAKLAGLSHVPCIVRKLDNREASAIALIENIQREDLNVMEEAQALMRLVSEFSLTHQQLAESLGKSRAAVSNLLRLNSLDPKVKKMLSLRELEMGHARALLTLDNNKQLEVAKIIVSKKLTVRQTEALVKTMLEPKKAKKIDFDQYSELQTRLSNKLGVSVSLSHKENGKGKIVISFEQKEKLDEILALFGESINNN